MKLCDIFLLEVSTEINLLADILTQDVLPLYRSMTETIQRIFDTSDYPVKASKYRVGSMMGKWFNNHYMTRGQYEKMRASAGLKDALKDLLQNSKISAEVKAKLKPLAELPIVSIKNNENYTTSSSNFKELEKNLPTLLILVGKQIGDSKIENAGMKWKESRENFYKLWNKLMDEHQNANKSHSGSRSKQERDDGEDFEHNEEKQKTIRQQYDAIEKIVNQVLKDLKPDVANEIRKSIARRGGNKLKALELAMKERGLSI